MDTKLIKASDCKCCVCGEQAYAFWPVIDPDIQKHPYCEKCLRKAQLQVLEMCLGKEEAKKVFERKRKEKN